MSVRIAVVHESTDDFEIATHLADRVLIEAVDWLDQELIAFQRDWIGQIPARYRLTWNSMPSLTDELGIKSHGHFDGQPAECDAHAARKAIRCIKATFDDLSAIVLVRDQDDQPERRLGLEQARRDHASSHKQPAIVIGFAKTKRECWVLCGFQTDTTDEAAMHTEERQRLGFDPCLHSHELTATEENATRCAKRALRQLIGNDRVRERRCWAETSLDILRERGQENGLAEYLNEIRTHLAPLFGSVPHRR